MSRLFGDDSAFSKRGQHKYDIQRVIIRSSSGIQTYDEQSGNCKYSPNTKLVVAQESGCDLDSGDFFFDNDSFWSGSITWY